MKKRYIFLCLLLLSAMIFGCSSKEDPETKVPEESGQEAEKSTEEAFESESETEETTCYNAAMITGGSDSILDGGMYQNAWKGMVSYAEAEGVSYHYYAAETEDSDAFLEQIHVALDKGAKIIIGFGNQMFEAVEEIAGDCPQVEFCVVDAAREENLHENVTILEFDEMEAGFIAGYASAMEGMDRFGFFSYGDMLENEYYYGFLQGVDVAGKYLTQKVSEIYTVSFGTSGEEETMREALREWLEEDGVDLIFCSEEAQLICSEMAAQFQTSVITEGDRALLSDLAGVNGVIVKDYERAVNDYLYGLHGTGHHYMNMSNDMIDYERNVEVFSAFSDELETTLVGSIEEKEDYLNRNDKISTADLGLEYVAFSY